jgi:hypothetical protein
MSASPAVSACSLAASLATYAFHACDFRRQRRKRSRVRGFHAVADRRDLGMRGLDGLDDSL